MTVPYDGEYLRDPRRACGAPSPTGNWCEAVEGHDGEHWFGLSERWPRQPATIDAEPRSGAGEGAGKGEASTEPLEAVFRPADVTISATGPEITIHGDERDLCVIDLANSETLRDMLDDVIGSVGGVSYAAEHDAVAAERDRLREAVKRVRELFARAPCDGCGHLAEGHGEPCRKGKTGECGCPQWRNTAHQLVIQALGEEA